MNRPRDSILVLFDPLNVALPPSPRSDATSPDSDKENATPDCAARSNDQLTMTTFFNRTYTRKPCCSAPFPLTPRGRLVDVSMDDATEGLVADDEEQETDSCHLLAQLSLENQPDDSRSQDDTISLTVATDLTTPRKGDELCMPLTTPRTPLAEIPFQIKITPIPRKKIYRRAASSPPHEATTATQPLTEYPQSLSAVVYNVSASGVSFSHPNPSIISEKPGRAILDSQEDTAHVSEDTPHGAKDNSFQIVVAPPPEDDRCHDSAPSQVISTSRFLRPRSQTMNTSLNAHRSSVDLHASFSLQIQCPDASFDLLNDKISFLGMEKSLLEEDEDQSDDITKEGKEMHNLVKVDDCMVRSPPSPHASTFQADSDEIRRSHPSTELVDARTLSDPPIPSQSHGDECVVSNERTNVPESRLLLAPESVFPEAVSYVKENVSTNDTHTAACTAQTFPYPVFIPPPPCTPVFPSRKKFTLPPLFAQPPSEDQDQAPTHVSALRIVKRKPAAGKGEKATSDGVEGKLALELEPTIVLSSVALKQKQALPRRLVRRKSVAPPHPALPKKLPSAVLEADIVASGGGGPQRLMTTTASYQAVPKSLGVTNNKLAADRPSGTESGKSGIPGPRRVPAPASMAAVVTRRKGVGGSGNGNGLTMASKNARGVGAGVALVSALPKPISRLPARGVRK